MFRSAVIRTSWARTPVASNRAFSAAAGIRMAEGDTGAPRASGSRTGDAWTNKEAALENQYVRRQEMQKLEALKKKLMEQRNHLDELERHIDEITKDTQGSH